MTEIQSVAAEFGTEVYRTSLLVRVTSGIGACIGAGLVVFVASSSSATWAHVLLIVPPMLVLVFMELNLLTDRIEVTPEQVVRRGVFHRERVLRWEDCRAARVTEERDVLATTVPMDMMDRWDFVIILGYMSLLTVLFPAPAPADHVFVAATILAAFGAWRGLRALHRVTGSDAVNAQRAPVSFLGIDDTASLLGPAGLNERTRARLRERLRSLGVEVIEA